MSSISHEPSVMAKIHANRRMSYTFPGPFHRPPRARSPRAEAVVRLFDLDLTSPGAARPDESQRLRDALTPWVHEITLLTGASGAGKSSLLRWMIAESAPPRTIVDLNAIEMPDVPVIDCFPDLSILDTMRHLARFGLGEAWSYLRCPGELSEGQRWRLRLAMALHACGSTGVDETAGSIPPRPRRRGSRRVPILVADEFASPLDRITARIIARALRKTVDAAPIAAVVATAHDDLADALAADCVAGCDFGVVTVMQGSRDGVR